MSEVCLLPRPSYYRDRRARRNHSTNALWKKLFHKHLQYCGQYSRSLCEGCFPKNCCPPRSSLHLPNIHHPHLLWALLGPFPGNLVPNLPRGFGCPTCSGTFSMAEDPKLTLLGNNTKNNLCITVAKSCQTACRTTVTKHAKPYRMQNTQNHT